jgi:hypothetical protein
MREGLDVFLHILDVQGIQQHMFTLVIGADGARHREQHDRKCDQYAEHQAEGIEKLGIRRI